MYAIRGLGSTTSPRYVSTPRPIRRPIIEEGIMHDAHTTYEERSAYEARFPSYKQDARVPTFSFKFTTFSPKFHISTPSRLSWHPDFITKLWRKFEALRFPRNIPRSGQSAAREKSCFCHITTLSRWVHTPIFSRFYYILGGEIQMKCKKNLC